SHPTDKSLANNAGAQIHDGYRTSEAGRDFDVTFPVHNPLSTSQVIAVQLLGSPAGLQPTFATFTTPFGPFEERVVNIHISVVPQLVGGGGTSHWHELTFVG